MICWNDVTAEDRTGYSALHFEQDRSTGRLGQQRHRRRSKLKFTAQELEAERPRGRWSETSASVAGEAGKGMPSGHAKTAIHFTESELAAEQVWQERVAASATEQDERTTKQGGASERSAVDETSEAATASSPLRQNEKHEIKGKAAKSAFTNLRNKTINQLKDDASNEISKLADSSENDAVRGADKYRLVARKGATAGTRYGKHRRTGREARLQRRENIKTVKGYQEKFKSEQYLQRTGKELPKAVRQQKRQQKRKQIRQYAEQKLGKNGKTIVDVGTRVMRFLAQAVRQAVGTVISFVAWPLLGAILIFLLLGGGFLLLFGLLSTTAATQLGSYTSDELDITEASQLATELEAKLEQQIAGIPAEWKWGHIDEFCYYVDPIGHDPFSLMAYLSAKRPGFDMALLSPIPHDVQQLHDNRYDLVLVEQVETRYRDVVYTDPITLIETTIQESYDYYKLNITLRSKSILAAVTPELAASSGGEQLEHYNLLMETKGARQEFGNPFGAGVNWSGSVSSLYGYRIDPIGGKNLQQHRGLDLAAPIGTPIYAGISGKVRYIGYTSALGYYLILEDSKGVAMQYAHCSSLTVTEGEAVAVGDKLAVVARSGAGTSSHLHIEIKRNGKYLNPIYFLEC